MSIPFAGGGGGWVLASRVENIATLIFRVCACPRLLALLPPRRARSGPISHYRVIYRHYRARSFPYIIKLSAIACRYDRRIAVIRPPLSALPSRSFRFARPPPPASQRLLCVSPLPAAALPFSHPRPVLPQAAHLFLRLRFPELSLPGPSHPRSHPLSRR